MTGAPICSYCDGPKPEDRFRMCPDCRAYFRGRNRRPGGPSEKLDAARDAIEWVLARASRDERLWHLIGRGSETWARLTRTHAFLTGDPVEAVQARFAMRRADHE